MKKKLQIEEIFLRLQALNQAPKTELFYTNHYTLLVAIVLSAQATDFGVNKATPALFEIADSPQKMLFIGEEGLKKYIKTIGLFNTKAKNIIGLSRELIDKYNSNIPVDFEELQKLPGVGRKTAKVFLNCAFDYPVIAVDTHVLRVSNRLGLVNTPSPLKTELTLEKIIPLQWKKYAHHWLILHGRYICKARKPECNICPLTDLCKYYTNFK